jgi:hypothetical protein
MMNLMVSFSQVDLTVVTVDLLNDIHQWVVSMVEEYF